MKISKVMLVLVLVMLIAGAVYGGVIDKAKDGIVNAGVDLLIKLLLPIIAGIFATTIGKAYKKWKDKENDYLDAETKNKLFELIKGFVSEGIDRLVAKYPDNKWIEYLDNFIDTAIDKLPVEYVNMALDLDAKVNQIALKTGVKPASIKDAMKAELGKRKLLGIIPIGK